MNAANSIGSVRSVVWALALLLVAGGAGLACDSGSANEQDPPAVAETYTVTVESIGESYAYSEQNSVGVAFAVDGEPGAVITLERGKTYEFELGDGVNPNHPFYIGNTAEGQGADAFKNGVDGATSTSGTVTFTVPMSAPDSLYYQCDNHVYMGGKMMIAPSSGGSDPY